MTFLLGKRQLISAIILFLVLFSIFHCIKPGVTYNEQGGFRPFGLGYKNKTIFPIWIIAIILAVFSYTLVISL